MFKASRCFLCAAKMSRQWLCEPCYEELPWNQSACERCALPLTSPTSTRCGNCLKHPPSFSATCCPLLYETPIKQLMLRFKQGDEITGHFLAQQFTAIQTLQHAPLVPVPMHTSALRERGFNPSLNFANFLAKQWQVDIAPILQCRKAHKSQKQLSAAQRRKNLHDAFAVKADCQPPRHVVLIDDVMTTGSTADTLSKLLLDHGVARVDVICLARTPINRLD